MHDLFYTKKNKLVLNAKSLSLELARQKHRLAAQLVCNILIKFFCWFIFKVSLFLFYETFLTQNDDRAENEIQDSSPSLTYPVPSDALNPENLTCKRRAWFISCVNEAIVQTLEEVSVNVSLPQREQVIFL